jgi:hypothetical protein
MPTRFKYRALNVLRYCIPALLFLITLSATIHWQQRLDALGCGRGDEVCASFALALHHAHGQGFSVAPGEPALLLEDSAWRLLLAYLTRVTQSPATAAYILGALCGLGTLLLGMALAVRFGYHPMTRWFFGFALLFAPGWLPGLVAGHSTPLAALLVMWAVSDHVKRMDRHELPLSLLLAGLVAVAGYVRLEFIWLWIIFALHYLLVAWRNREPWGERGYIVLRALAGLLLILLALVPLAAWHWPMLGWPPLRIPGAPLSTENEPMWQLILIAIPKAYARWVHSPYWHTWALMVLAIAGAIGLALRAWRQREARSAFIVPLALVLMPFFYALTYPLTGWPESDVVFAAFDPLGALACAIAASRVPDWIARGLRRRYFLHAHWVAALRIATCLLLAIAAMLEAMHWNAQWSAETHARIRTRNALRNLLAPVSYGARPPLVLTDQPGWAIWDTAGVVVDISGRLTPDFIAHRNGRDVLAVEKVRNRLGAVSYAVVWDGKAPALLKELMFEKLPALAPAEAGFPAPQIYRFKRPPAPLPVPPTPPPPAAP